MAKFDNTRLAPLDSPVLTGDPQAPTPAAADNDTSIATTAFVKTAVSAGGGGGAGVIVSDTAPASPPQGQLWFESSTGILWISYFDGTSTQWVGLPGSGGIGPTTGDVKATFKTVADPGWIMLDDGAIGDASSGSTTRANADTVNLFALFWNNVPTLVVQDSTGAPVTRGINATTDFNAHRRLVLPLALGRSLAVAGTGAGLTARALGTNAGAETETPTQAKTAYHAHGTYYAPGPNDSGEAGGAGYGAGAYPWVGGYTGDNAPLNILDPSVYLNVMVKL